MDKYTCKYKYTYMHIYVCQFCDHVCCVILFVFIKQPELLNIRNFMVYLEHMLN